MVASTKAQRRQQGLFPSRDVDVETALQLLDWSWYRFARSTAALDAARARALLEALPRWADEPAPNERQQGRRRCAFIFLETATVAADEQHLRSAWRDAVDALKAFEAQYAWGSKEKAASLRAVSKRPALVRGAQAAAVATLVVPLELLAVLALEGSEASVDALMPHVERALQHEGALEQLVRLERFLAPTPAMQRLAALLSSRVAAARAASPVRALATRLGLDGGKRFRVELRLVGARGGGLYLDLDSERAGPAVRGSVQHPT
ncbi:MAG: hypothetical protein SFW67_32735, partial [Myxococcaceae bacterium]|nr:hypothetical protein [Myxococcaceae bacterium]